MAIPVHLFLTDDGGALIRGSSDVQGREGSMEVRALHHSLSLPTDPMTGKVTSTRQHSPFHFTKELDSASPYLFKASATGQTLKSAEFRFYHINDAGQEVEYYRIINKNGSLMGAVFLSGLSVASFLGAHKQRFHSVCLKNSPASGQVGRGCRCIPAR
ncbi:Hcp family type VI secretion system effector [Chimaeribacter arupi]|uniref:Type VI secretion system tube protein Hcp n=1 Tax=Chimaeribacter arupi TaxID=2060066 RepID=A0A2N5EKM6_9GAMM|nr:type VI secretion system tube protein TssD [Chimaeribacter arupi]PLR47075.1 hypothetical protein CYR34_15150 [Chimaeribacter arupi]